MKSRFVRVPSLVVVTAILSAGCGPSSEEPALPDGGAVVDAGKPDLLDPARFRAAAQCADCDVLNIARLNLPATGVGAASAKMRAPDGRFFELTLRDSDERADEPTLLADERRAVHAKYGKLQPELHAWTRSAVAGDRAWVWIWASVPDYEVARERLLTDAVFAAAHEERVKADLDAALAPIREKLTGAELGESSGPMLRARLTPDEVRAIEALPQVALLGTDSYPGKGTSLPWSNASQWNPTLRLDLAQYLSTGAGIRVCVKEDGRPDDTSALSIANTANPSGPTSWHMRGMAGIIRNTLPPVSTYNFRSVAPGASVYIANWLGYAGSVDEWCRSQSTNVLSYSWEVAPAGTGLTATDWAHDWLAKNSPYMVVVASAGPIGGYDTVLNRGFNGLVVGAVDDMNTADRSDDVVMPSSAWRNPTTAHGDLELPHVVAPGNGFNMAGAEWSGTSVATAMASGVTALLTAGDLGGWPEGKRAVILATAIGRADQGLITSLSSAGDTKIGAGEIDAFLAADLGNPANAVAANAVTARGRTAFTATFASSFGTDSYLTTRWKAHANVTGRMRVAIAWDATATCPSGVSGACTADTPDADLDLHLYKKTDATWTMTGTMACSSARWDSTWELCDIPVSAGEDYLIGIRKYGTSGASTYLGVAWMNYVQPVGQPCTTGTECANGTCYFGRCGCYGDYQCPDRYCDASGACATRLPNGLGCNRAEQCASGSCVEGICCDTACTGTCMACSAGKKGYYPDGICGAIANGLDPDGECAGQSCSSGTVTQAQKCNGAGACASPGSYSCMGYVCAGTGCKTTCSSGADCASGYYCSGSTCLAKKPNGYACAGTLECASGACADGVCCDTACGGTCQACTAAKKGWGADGTCSPIAYGLDPEGECTAQSCSAGTVTRAWICNGGGACTSNGSYSCSGYMCTGSACRTTCSGDGDCVSSHYCSGGTCTLKKANGAACSAGNQCNSASCVDGVCCDTACTGTCMACSAVKKGSGVDGTCGAIGDARNPDGECAPQSCTGGTVTLAQVCNGAGACRANGTTSCGGFGCSGAGCATSCATSAGCASTHYCVAGACVVKKTNGATCADTSECGSGNCVDGVCCNTGCGAACQACNVPGSVGTCTATDEAGCAPICGTGVRNLAEECDDGLGTATTPRRPCSSTCSIVDLLVVPLPSTSTTPIPVRALGKGRHPIAVGTSGHGIVYVEDAKSSALIGLATFDANGNAQDPPKVVKTGAAFEANPVVAAIPGNQYVVAYTDIGGDGDSLGVLLQKVDPTSGALGTAVTANQTTSFSQYDADLIWTGSELVAAWVDTSSFTTGADLKLRRFNASLAPLGPEESLATTTAAESDLALVPYAGTWAAAWRAAESGTERIVVRTGTTTWSIDVTAPAPAGVRPSIVPLDTTHLFVVFAEDAPAHLRGAVIDTTTTGGTVSSFAVQSAPTTTPVVARVGSRLFLAWTRQSGAPTGDDAFFQEITWTGTAVDLSSTVRPLPRLTAHQVGDQRAPALAGMTALITAWEDYGASLGAPRTAVATQWVPLPLFRSSP